MHPPKKHKTIFNGGVETEFVPSFSVQSYTQLEIINWITMQ